jgi:ribosomal protein L21E
MKNGKLIREKGKIRLSEYFKQIKNGENVALVGERSIPCNFPSRVIGLTGKIIGDRGSYKIVDIMDGGKKKRYIVHPIHLKILKTNKNNKKDKIKEKTKEKKA